MGTHSASGKARPARVKYVYVTPTDGDTPVNGAEAPTPRKVGEISLPQRFKDLGIALLIPAVSVAVVLGSRVTDWALEWHPGQTDKPVQAETVDLAPRAFTAPIVGPAGPVTVHAFAEDDPTWQCASQGNGKCGKGPVNAQ